MPGPFSAILLSAPLMLGSALGADSIENALDVSIPGLPGWTLFGDVELVPSGERVHSGNEALKLVPTAQEGAAVFTAPIEPGLAQVIDFRILPGLVEADAVLAGASVAGNELFFVRAEAGGRVYVTSPAAPSVVVGTSGHFRGQEWVRVTALLSEKKWDLYVNEGLAAEGLPAAGFPPGEELHVLFFPDAIEPVFVDGLEVHSWAQPPADAWEVFQKLAGHAATTPDAPEPEAPVIPKVEPGGEVPGGIEDVSNAPGQVESGAGPVRSEMDRPLLLQTRTRGEIEIDRATLRARPKGANAEPNRNN